MAPINPRSCNDTTITMYLQKKQKAVKNCLKNFYPGGSVSTRNLKVLTIENPEERKKQSNHNKVYGFLIKTSLIDQAYWLVKVYNNKLFYCHNKVQHIKNQEANTCILTNHQMEMISQARFEHLTVEHETILKSVSFPLTLQVPSQNAFIVRSIVQHLEPYHP